MRLTRSQQQARTKSAVLTAARWEFSHFGFAEAKVDRIAERADLTRGAVYSNFPSKRSLYLAVLLASLSSPSETVAPNPVDVPSAVEAFARVWLERLPLATDDLTAGRLQSRSLTGVADGGTLAQLARLEALLLAVALESLGAGRKVRLSELVLTMLDGAAHLAETAPGFGDPFDVARACRHLATLDLADEWDPPHLPYVPAAHPVREPWTVDGLDGLVVVLGSERLEAAEEAVRAARPTDTVTVALVTDDPAETGALLRLRITDLTACLQRVVGPVPPRIVLDDQGVIAAAVGAPVAAGTESAVRVEAGHIIARADGRGAGHAAGVAR
ncbi:TetR/AcrR family transcriptional regulator [Paractinoplanes bogorensis]|uniref:TetR/AcrR family transcriptional regulator n=1 Tax=Paractinoplanes bogorensis TaxID=1610840 RepID=UPI0027E20E3E|nr:TetR family transcriptional regulator [Actinoplanes bogorensis]